MINPTIATLRRLRLTGMAKALEEQQGLPDCDRLSFEERLGNPGLGPPQGPPPAWQGFRPLRVSRKLHESSNVTSLVLEPADGQPLTAALAGQFIVLRLRPGPDESALLRSYSLSDATSEDRYRISIKREPHGAAGAYIDTRVQAGE